MKSLYASLILLPLALVLGCGSNPASPSATPDFALAAAPTSLSLQSGGGARSLSVTVSSIASFNDPVTITPAGLPAGVTASPATLSLAPGQIGQFQLTAGSTAAASTPTITLTGTAGSLSHTASAALTITPTATPDFALASAPTSLSLQSGGAAQPLSVTVSSLASFSGTVNVALSGLPAGVTASPATLSLTPGQIAQFQLTADSTTTDTSATVTLTATSGSLTHTATAALNLSPAAASDFTLASAPDSLTLQSGGSNRSLSVTVGSVAGFSDSVTVALTGLPDGVTATPATLSLTPGQLGQFTLSASSAAVAGTGSVTVMGTSGSLSHTALSALTISAAAVPDFTLAATPATLSIQSGGSAGSLSVTVSSLEGFSSSVSVALTGLPSGVTTTPSTLSLSPGQVGQFQLTASSAAVPGNATVTVTGTSGTLAHTQDAALTITAAAPIVSNASLSSNSFDFGGNFVGSTLTNSTVTITNTGTADITLSPTLTGDPSFSIVPAGSCGSTLAAGASCVENVSYTPTVASTGTPQTATLNLGLGNVPAGTASTVTLTGTAATLPQGTVTATNNPQVALYTMTLPYPGSMTVSFGPDTTYGKQTWTQSTTTAGGTVSIYVAGMLANSTYHMQATVQLANGVTVTDVDHTFTTGTPEVQPNLTVTTTPGMTPQSGIEQLTTLEGSSYGIIDTDLQGNVLWSYALPNNPVGADGQDEIDGVKLMQNGDFLITVAQGSSYALSGGPTPPGVVIAVREINLAGDIVRELTATDLTNELQTAGYNITISEFHHDLIPMPNGHWIVLASTFETVNPAVDGYTNILGDVVVDLDQNLEPVWVWNSFDHLDVTRHPMGFPDWTHTNTVLYSPTDHNLIISMRHQNWVMKLDYQDGTGSGNILWHLGEGGDFKLVGGTDPTDWNYAQHYPSYFSANSAGVFSLGMMDNGNDRIFPDGGMCGTGLEPVCYTTIPVFQLDETAMTATLTFHQVLPTSLYNSFGGNTELLANGDIEYDLCGLADGGSEIFEVTPDNASPQTVWHMVLSGSQAYRGYRQPSLYPGVQW